MSTTNNNRTAHTRPTPLYKRMENAFLQREEHQKQEIEQKLKKMGRDPIKALGAGGNEPYLGEHQRCPNIDLMNTMNLQPDCFLKPLKKRPQLVPCPPPGSAGADGMYLETGNMS